MGLAKAGGGVVVAFVVVGLAVAVAGGPPVAASPSEATEACLGCHGEVTPGIVGDWRRSRHARTTPSLALERPPLARRFSARVVPEGTGDAVVGCAECHTRNPGAHADTFEHNGFQVHIVVTPEDCAGCHPEERAEYADNLMANAYGNLMDNPVFAALVAEVNGPAEFRDGRLVGHASTPMTDADACLACHGTRVTVKGTQIRDTAMGEMAFPVLTGWPNQGVGRVNPDGSRGACTPCHTRHGFSIEEARRPAACEQCHKGPDVPAYKVYEVSKHAAVFHAAERTFDLRAVPWVLGEDFVAPTCAACHVSLVTSPSGEVLARRTHRMADRLEYRLFGAPYATAHPATGDTTGLRTPSGLPLAAELTGEPAADGLIGEDERVRRRERMASLCKGCHSGQWVRGHFDKLAHTVETTNALVRTATGVLAAAWDAGAASGPAQGGGLFDEAIEKMWVRQWLFYANATRLASAMAGADYGVFANGRWHLKRNLAQMVDWLAFHRGLSDGSDGEDEP